jgi:hypothetical protein
VLDVPLTVIECRGFTELPTGNSVLLLLLLVSQRIDVELRGDGVFRA